MPGDLGSKILHCLHQSPHFADEDALLLLLHRERSITPPPAAEAGAAAKSEEWLDLMEKPVAARWRRVFDSKPIFMPRLIDASGAKAEPPQLCTFVPLRLSASRLLGFFKPTVRRWPGMAGHDLDLYCVGQPLLDIQLEVSEATLKAALAGRRGPRGQKGARSLCDPNTLEEMLAEPALAGMPRVLSAGGAACNTTFGFVSLGGKAGLTGKVGADEHASAALADLRSRGVDILGDTEDPEGDTGVCLSLATPDAERTMMTSLGVSGKLTKADVDWDALRSASCLLVELYLWAVPAAAEMAEAAIEAAVSSGTLVCLALSDAGMVDAHRETVLRLLDSVDILLGNEDEALALFELSTPSECVAEAALTCGRVVVTLGEKGTLLSEAGAAVEHVPAITEGVTAVDTTGCGDIFASAVLAGVLCRHSSLADAARVGTAAAACVAGRLGPRLLPEEADRLSRGPAPRL